MACAAQRTFAIVKRCVRERGIHALHSLGLCCRRAAVSSKPSTTTRGRSNNLSATLGLIGRALTALLRRLSPCWYGSRTRDSQIIGLVLYPLS